jgi:hypothetical protein
VQDNGDCHNNNQQQHQAGGMPLHQPMISTYGDLEDISTCGPVSPSTVIPRPRLSIGPYVFGPLPASSPAVAAAVAGPGARAAAISRPYTEPQGRVSALVGRHGAALSPAPSEARYPATRSTADLPAAGAPSRRVSRSLDILPITQRQQQQQQQQQMLGASPGPPAAAAAVGMRGGAAVTAVWAGGVARRHSTGSIIPPNAAAAGGLAGGVTVGSMWVPSSVSGTCTAAAIGNAAAAVSAGDRGRPPAVAWGAGSTARAISSNGGEGAGAGYHGAGDTGDITVGSSLPGMVETGAGSYVGVQGPGGTSTLRHGAALSVQEALFGAAGAAEPKPHVRSSWAGTMSPGTR